MVYPVLPNEQPLNVVTWDPGKYGSGKSRKVYIDGQQRGDIQIPASYAGKEEEYIQLQIRQGMFGRGEYKTPGQVTSEQQARSKQITEQKEAYRLAGAEAHRQEQESLKGYFMGREAQARVYGGTTQTPIVGIEAAKAAELQAAREETARRQSEQATTPTEALAIQRMLRSPTAQFASQEAAQRGYELASRYDRSFAPEQVRATLAPQYQPQIQEQRVPSRFFAPAPREQAGIRPAFPTPARPGSIAEREAFERRTRGFYTYGTVRRLEAVSSRLQTGLERVVGYDERSSIPVKAAVGFGSAFTGLPAFAGQVAGAGEAIIRYPSAALRGLPTGFKILSSQVAEQATTKPVEFAGSLAGYVALGKLQSKLPTYKEIKPYVRPTIAGVKELAKSEAATSYFGGARKAFVSKVESPYANKMNIDVTQAAIRKMDFRRSMEAPITKPTRPAPRQILETRIENPPQEYISGAKAESLADVLYEATLEKQIRAGGKGYVSEARLKEARSIDEIMIQQAKKQKQLARIRQEESVSFKSGRGGYYISAQKQIASQIPVSKAITKQVPESVSIQKSRTKLIPMAVSISAQKQKYKQVSELVTKQIPMQITKQTTWQRQTPIVVQRERQKQPLIPVGITISTPKLKIPTPLRPKIETPIIPKRPPQITPEKIKTPLRPREPFTPETPRIPKRHPPKEPPRQYKKPTSEILKSSSILRGARRYTTKLGGKTLKQLSAELKGKKTIRRKRKK
jgi:hypothetical protein